MGAHISVRRMSKQGSYRFCAKEQITPLFEKTCMCWAGQLGSWTLKNRLNSCGISVKVSCFAIVGVSVVADLLSRKRLMGHMSYAPLKGTRGASTTQATKHSTWLNLLALDGSVVPLVAHFRALLLGAIPRVRMANRIYLHPIRYLAF